MNETKELCEFVFRLKQEQMPKEVVSIVKECILDYLGVTFAGAFEVKKQLNAYLDTFPVRNQESGVIGLQRKTSIEEAALLNGISAHYFELDDGNRFGMVHLGAPILSSLFSIADVYNVSSDKFLQAVFVGYEVTIRLASAIQPSHKKKGFHATGTCGCIGAAVAVAIALDIKNEYLENIISAAVASASGLLEMIDDTSQLKPFNAGKAAQNGIIAVRMGCAGFVGPQNALGGSRGFLNVMAEEIKGNRFDGGNDKDYAIFGIYRKPYASCRHCHAAVEAVISLNKMYDIQPENITEVHVSTYSLAVFGHDHKEIASIGSAKMSIPYSVAAAIVLNDGGIRSMSEEAMHNPDILALAKKVCVSEEATFSSMVPNKRIAQVTIGLKSGTKFTKKVIYPKGEPENPMTTKELREKFIQMAMYAGKSKDYYTKVIQYTTDIENHFADLVEIL